MKRALCWILAVAIVSAGTPLPALGQTSARVPQALDLPKLIEEPYVSLFEQALELNVPKASIEAFRKTLEEKKKQERSELEKEKKSIEQKINQAQDELKRLNGDEAATADKRHDLHCRIQGLREQLQQTDLSLNQGLNITYDNKLAKLRVLEEWPAKYAETQRLIDSRQAEQRNFGDFRDIGFRDGTFKDQQDDVKTGQNALEEMKHQGILPPEVEDPQVVAYVRDLSTGIARHSDLQVPLRVFVLSSKEINAFALPGGLLFVNSGLILKADKESELAGVIAHELAHSAARHGHRLMKRATIASIIYQAAQIAALIFTGGVASIGTYYALQYGFYGLGLLLSLELLGVSRDYEIEADILGTQYLWQAGYNTRGFISFFDRMAQEKGYITGLSWFRTHPPFYERMERTYQEIVFLPDKPEAIDDSSEFQAAQKRLQQVVLEMEKKDRDAPTLRRVYECEEPPTTTSP